MTSQKALDYTKGKRGISKCVYFPFMDEHVQHVKEVSSGSKGRQNINDRNKRY